MASIDRTAYPRFARAVSARELAEVFTPSTDEMEWARSKTQDDQHFLALLVWLKAYQRLGYFPKLADVPAVVTQRVRSVVGLPDDVVLAEAAERSAKRHCSFVRTHLGVDYDPAGVRAVATEAIRKAAQAKDNPADLINVALEELVRARCELPGYTTLDDLTKTIRTEVNRGFYTLLVGTGSRSARWSTTCAHAEAWSTRRHCCARTPRAARPDAPRNPHVVPFTGAGGTDTGNCPDVC
ncbi:DUF4158 domain-containing protein [Streptosporangium sp. NPDC048047]|uniref:DUF4158 domain-containing protein n=1 Tax=Streptosporangium sp. NPDC048047 TaxID=3155748 RepID=UPI00342A45E8